MSTIYYTASSLDGFIVDDDGSLDWLTSRDIDTDGFGGYTPFIAGVGAIVMGATTYEWVVEHEDGAWPYEMPAWVVTHRPEIVRRDHEGVQAFSGAVTDLHPRLLEAAGANHVWVVGGGHLAAQYVAAGLIDEMWVHFAPCTLGSGRPVLPVRSEWTLADTGRNRDFVGARWLRA